MSAESESDNVMCSIKDEVVNNINEEDKVILKQIASSGALVELSWKNGIQRVFERQIELAMKCIYKKVSFITTCNYTFESRSQEVLKLLNGCEEAPFTIQRLSELLLNYDIYKSSHKLCNAIEKLLSVTSSCVIINKVNKQSINTDTSSGSDHIQNTESIQNMDSQVSVSASISISISTSPGLTMKRTHKEAISTDEVCIAKENCEKCDIEDNIVDIDIDKDSKYI